MGTFIFPVFQKRLSSLFYKLNHVRWITKVESSTLSKQWKRFDEHDVKNHVANILHCSQKEADAFVDSLKDEFAKDRCGRIEILRALRNRGFNLNNVISCKAIMKEPLENVRERIKFSSKILQDESPETIISVLRLREGDLEKIKKFIATNHTKIDECSALFKASKIETYQLFIKYPFLLRSKMSTLKRKIDLLTENDKISIQDVVKDLWVLTYTWKKLENRLEEINSMNIHPVKPWMLRCLPEVLMRTYSHRQENKAALGPHPNAIAYLSNRLDLHENDINKFAKKHPPVMRVQVAKMKEIIDYLLAEGYPASKIVNTPRILCHSIETIQERLNLLKARKYAPKTLSVLCKPKRSFDEFVKRVDNYSQQSERPS